MKTRVMPLVVMLSSTVAYGQTRKLESYRGNVNVPSGGDSANAVADALREKRLRQEAQDDDRRRAEAERQRVEQAERATFERQAELQRRDHAARFAEVKAKTEALSATPVAAPSDAERTLEGNGPSADFWFFKLTDESCKMVSGTFDGQRQTVKDRKLSSLICAISASTGVAECTLKGDKVSKFQGHPAPDGRLLMTGSSEYGGLTLFVDLTAGRYSRTVALMAPRSAVTLVCTGAAVSLHE